MSMRRRSGCAVRASTSASCSSSTVRCACWTCSIRTATGSSLRKSFPAAELERVLGARPVRHERVESGGYGRVSAHWRVELVDGRRVFVKQALTDDAAEWVGRERRFYESVRGTFLPAYLGGHDDGDSVWIVI